MSRTWTGCLSALLAICLVWPTASHAEAPLPSEPGDDVLINQTYDAVVGLLFRDYSLQGNGHVDYRTARHILSISYDDPTSEEPDVAEFPLFYWYDADQNGQWAMWVDREETGRQIDAVRYDWKQGEDLLTLYQNLRNPS